MLLNDIGRCPSTTLSKINKHLETNYGFKISEDVDDVDLTAIVETIQSEIALLKMNGNNAHSSSEITKRLLILEGLNAFREFDMPQNSFSAPEYEQVLDGMIDFVVKTFHCTATTSDSQDAFDEALHDAMKIYNSSKYRFPEGFEQDVRSGAMAKISTDMNGSAPLPLGEDTPSDVGDIIDRSKEFATGKDLAQPELINKSDKGTIMNERKNLVKNLRALLETEVSQAEVMMAAKGFAQELQEMVEKIGRLQNEDLPPVTDQMRETYGNSSSSAFQTQIYGALQGVMDSLYTAKNQVDDAVANMASTGQVTASVDMDKELAGPGMSDDMSGSDDSMPSEIDLDNIEGELAGDEFAAADSEDPLGRAMKTEALLQRKIMEMKHLVARARKLNEVRK